MTLFKLMSDLHLEFYNDNVWKPMPNDQDKNTVLLLAGDIGVGLGAKAWITEMCGRFRYVLYILGNHEFYRQEIYKTKQLWQDMEMPDNFRFLDDQVAYIDDARILGGTLWTRLYNNADRWFIQESMNDFGLIKINENGYYHKLNTQNTDRLHDATTNFFCEELAKPWTGKTIVMTHHLPHLKCVSERFKDNPLNAAFVTDLQYIFDMFDIDVWVHGHTHDSVDTHVGKTRILCNPRGYHGYEINPDFNEDLVFYVGGEK